MTWTVTIDQIDADRWARAVVNALQGGKESRDQATRWGTWPALLLAFVLLVAVAALTGGWMLVAGLVPVVVFLGLLFLLNRQSVDRIAKQIRSTPSALEPFTLSADQFGTRSESPSGSDQLAWNRYRDVFLDDDLVALTLDDKTVRILPMATLSSGHTAAEAVESSRPGSRTLAEACHPSSPGDASRWMETRPPERSRPGSGRYSVRQPSIEQTLRRQEQVEERSSIYGVGAEMGESREGHQRWAELRPGCDGRRIDGGDCRPHRSR